MSNRLRTRTKLALLATLAAAPLAAQDAGGDAGRTLAARMAAFVDAAFGGEADLIASFFPRRGDWTWVQTWKEDARTVGTGTWRFPAAETVRAIDGPACVSFDVSGEIGPAQPALWTRLGGDAGDWRRVPGNRFVPRAESARSPVFIQWRREDGAWVIAAYGDVHAWAPRLLGTEPGMISRDTSLVPEGAAYAAGADWYRDNMPISLGGMRYVKHGAPRVLPENDRRHLERIGVLGRVSVYIERGSVTGPVPDILYLPVAAGEFQVYTGSGHLPCDGSQP